ncbi:hypothetical protein E2562_002104 [Oryza meyeriana var. granulata]|uniref:Uncharacterized protein n=1 Tax=Oryza meyeriana var. granulata TaxID=110450 RepID=A0A6G1EEK9_9ORYZ|nr:hypothetical protein E2562_002104 [Oryza meyeriana var. granulata]
MPPRLPSHELPLPDLLLRRDAASAPLLPTRRSIWPSLLRIQGGFLLLKICETSAQAEASSKEGEDELVLLPTNESSDCLLRTRHITMALDLDDSNLVLKYNLC